MELMALRLGLKLVLEHNPCPIKINIDLEEVIQMLHKGNLLYNPIINEYKLLLRRLGGSPIHHSYREKNKIVDALEKNGAKKDYFKVYRVFVVPSPLTLL